MSALEHPVIARPKRISPKSRPWHAVGEAFRWLDSGKKDPYSPLVCVSMLLLVGLMVELGPGLHALLVH